MRWKSDEEYKDFMWRDVIQEYFPMREKPWKLAVLEAISDRRTRPSLIAGRLAGVRWGIAKDRVVRSKPPTRKKRN